MDSDEDAFEEPVRTSPRFSTKRSPRKKQAEEALTSCSHGSRIPKKRKTDQNVDRKFTKQKQKVGFKCAPHMLHELFRKLNDEQRIWVEEIGFGSLMNMPCCRLPKGLTVWLINQVSWKRKALIVGGRTIQIKNLVKEMLGIPDGPIPVPLVRSKRGKSKCTNPPGDDRELKDQKAGRGLSCKSTYDSLIGTNEPVQFKRDFMLYVLCIYFAPSSGHFINRSYCPVLSQVDHIKDMNWCDHVAEFLFEGILDYTESSALNVNVHGCVHILLLIYIGLVKSTIVRVAKGPPRANYVDSDSLELLDYHDLKFTTRDSPVYGKLEICDSIPPAEGNIMDKLANSPRKHKQLPKSCTKHRQSPIFRNNKPNNGRSPSSGSIDPNKRFAEELQKIEDQYAEAREMVYEDSFNMLRNKMNKIDSVRRLAICALREEFPITTETDAAADGPSINQLSSQKTRSASIISQATVRQEEIPAHSTPLKLSSSVITTSAGTIKKAVSNLSPTLDFSFKFHPSRRIHGSTPLNLADKCSTPSELLAEVTGNGMLGSANESEKSYDLQHTCRQLFPIYVKTQQGHKSTKKAQKVDCTRDCTVEESLVLANVPINQSKNDDPLGFDIMKEVMAIAIEASQQVCTDVDTPDYGVEDIVNNSDSMSSLPVQGCQGLESSLGLGYPFPNSQLCLNPVLNLYGQCISQMEHAHAVELCSEARETTCSENVVSQSQADLIITSDDGIDRAAAIIEADNIQTPLFPANGMGRATQVSSLHYLSMPSTLYSTQPITSYPDACTLQLYGATYIPDSPERSSRHDVENIITVSSPIKGGHFFTDAGSVNIAVRSRAKRFGTNEHMIDGIAELKKTSSKIKPATGNATYSDHAERSSFWETERKEQTDPTQEEFVHTLKPDGVVDLNFMWLCSVAIMLDWQSNTRTILNQTIIKELMKPHDSCDHKRIAKKLKRLRIDLIEQLYLPVRKNKQWVLMIISIVGNVVEIYDPVKAAKKGDDPYYDLWRTVGSNLQIAYSCARSKEVRIHDNFEKHYAQIHSQNNINDSGLEVIRLLVAHNRKNLIGYGKKNMSSYRKEVAHTLLFHRFNDLNPKRNEVENEEVSE